MIELLKKCALGLAVIGTLGLNAGMAQADALAVSDILISNLLFTNGTRTLDSSDFAVIVFTNSGDVLASIGSTTVSQSSVGSPLDLYACVGSGCPANNTFPFLGPPATGTFATADQLESGAPITGLGFTTGATVDAAGYASTTTNADPSAQSNNGLSSTFVFTLNQTTGVNINFDAQAYLDAWTAAGQIFPTNALASYSVCFTVTPVGSTSPIINWCPDGINNNDLGITSSTEPFSLNTNASRNSPFNGNTTTGAQSGFFSATTIPLFAGIPYQLSARENATADALEVPVPEPGSLMLLAAGLLGLGAAGGLRRRKG